MSQIPESIEPALWAEFFRIAPAIIDHLDCQGCNDHMMQDTPANRDLADWIDAQNQGMSLEDWRASEHYDPQAPVNGQIFTLDVSIVEAALEMIRRQHGS